MSESLSDISQDEAYARSLQAQEDAAAAAAAELVSMRMTYQQPAVVDWSSRAAARDNDLHLARRLQQLEVESAARTLARDEEARRNPTQLDQEKFLDPIWGSFPARKEDGSPPHPCSILCLSCCPCCVPPCCSLERKEAWKKVLSSASFVLSVLQIILLIVSLSFRGFAPLTINSMLGPYPQVLNTMQAKNTALIIVKGQIWRLFTPIFLHAGIIHLVSNLAMQLRIGLFLENSWGKTRYLLIYILAGIFAETASAVFLPESLGVGASGALMGVMGASVTELLLHWGMPSTSLTERSSSVQQSQHMMTGSGDIAIDLSSPPSNISTREAAIAADETHQQRIAQLMIAVINIGIIMAFSFTPLIDWAAHLFGLIGGVLIAGAIFGNTFFFRFSSLAAFTFCLIIGISVLYSGIIYVSEPLLNY
jgi:membrane associated rhomboid family serine protease